MVDPGRVEGATAVLTGHRIGPPPAAGARERAGRRVVRVLAALVAGTTVAAGVAIGAGSRATPTPSSPTVAPVSSSTATVPSTPSPTTPTTTTTPTTPSPTRTVDGIWPATGALFAGPADDPGDHFCTASVVASTPGDVIMTAAHCVADGDGTPARTGMSFAPGYQDGAAPDGYWSVTSALVDPAWLATGDPDDDIAFLTVTQPGSAPIQAVTGAYTVAFDDPAAGTDGTPVSAVGYNVDEQEATTTTGTTVTWSATQLRLDSPGLSDGTSGGPWLTGPDDTEIVGVTGGYEQGGDTADVSYTAVLGAAIRDIYDQVGGTG